MFETYPSPNDQHDANRTSVWGGPFLWTLALGAALVVYQLTDNLLYAAAVPYFQAAAEPFRCALWLLSVDPNRPRGRAYFLFYLALAFWLAAISALVSFAILMWVNGQKGQQPPLDQLVLTMLTLFGGALLGSITAAVAAIHAYRSKIKIWAHPNLRNRCGGDFNRLAQSDLGDNYVFYLVTVSGVLCSRIAASNPAECWEG